MREIPFSVVQSGIFHCLYIGLRYWLPQAVFITEIRNYARSTMEQADSLNDIDKMTELCYTEDETGSGAERGPTASIPPCFVPLPWVLLRHRKRPLLSEFPLL